MATYSPEESWDEIIALKVTSSLPEPISRFFADFALGGITEPT
jgi:hypothetical protein